MKRYIKSSNYDRLRYELDGQGQWLPTWFADASDEEIDSLKQMIIEDHNNRKDASPEYDDEDDFIELDLKDLRAEGFSKSDIDEIIAMIENGHTVDSAIQRQHIKKESRR